MTATCGHEHDSEALASLIDATSTTDRSSIPVTVRLPHLAIRAYRWLFAARVSPCRFEPSCSTYALESLETHGLVRGTWLAVRRLGRCHPWGGHGWDPVPPRRAA
jgi:hypothetical protein